MSLFLFLHSDCSLQVQEFQFEFVFKSYLYIYIKLLLQIANKFSCFSSAISYSVFFLIDALTMYYLHFCTIAP